MKLSSIVSRALQEAMKNNILLKALKFWIDYQSLSAVEMLNCCFKTIDEIHIQSGNS